MFMLKNKLMLNNKTVHVKEQIKKIATNDDEYERRRRKKEVSYLSDK